MKTQNATRTRLSTSLVGLALAGLATGYGLGFGGVDARAQFQYGAGAMMDQYHKTGNPADYSAAVFFQELDRGKEEAANQERMKKMLEEQTRQLQMQQQQQNQQVQPVVIYRESQQQRVINAAPVRAAEPSSQTTFKPIERVWLDSMISPKDQVEGFCGEVLTLYNRENKTPYYFVLTPETLEYFRTHRKKEYGWIIKHFNLYAKAALTVREQGTGAYEGSHAPKEQIEKGKEFLRWYLARNKK